MGSTQGRWSGAFNNAPQEDDDELRVPCDPSSPAAVAASAPSFTPSATAPAAAVVTKTRKVSDFISQYVDEDVLAEMTSTLISSPSPSASASSARGFSFARTLSSFDLGAAEPTTTSLSALDNAWMNKAFQTDDFTSLMVFNDPSLSPPALTTTLEVATVDFDDLLEAVPSLQEEEQLPAAASAPPVNQKKRGRPAAPAPVSAAPKKARLASPEVVPATPKPHASTRPASNNPDDVERYIKYRNSNNEAACKSRLRRKERERENAERVVVLEAQNVELKNELASLRSECSRLKALLEEHLCKLDQKK